MNTKYIDLTGQKFGRLTVIKKGNGRYTKGGQYKATWFCRCECGNEREFDSEKLRRGHTLSCGCIKSEFATNINFSDITGQKFGRLTVIRFLKPEEREDWRRQWLCKCECGNEVQVNSNKLRSGSTKSCGCISVEFASNINRKYEHVSKRLYSVYKGMISRCYDKRHRAYKSYGGRGITVCQEWLDNYDTFAEWALKSGYDEKAEHGECTIDRIDVEKGYSPDNCRWITNQQQQNNRRDNIYAEYNGERHTAMEWSRILGISYQKITWHLKRGKTIEQILNI